MFSTTATVAYVPPIFLQKRFAPTVDTHIENSNIAAHVQNIVWIPNINPVNNVKIANANIVRDGRDTIQFVRFLYHGA